MPRHTTTGSDEISATSNSTSWLTTAASAISTPPRIPRSSKKDRPAESETSKSTKTLVDQLAQAPNRQKRTPLEDYFHEQSKLFSSLQKRFVAFQTRAAEERGKKKPAAKHTPKVVPRVKETIEPKEKSSQK